MICQRLPSFTASPALYWVSVYALSWITLWLAIRWPVTNRRFRHLVFVLLAMGLLFMLRLPTIVYDREMSPDESQMLAQAMTLHQDPVYFRSVDGTTGGPLNSYLLVIPAFFGLPFDYVTAHLMAYVLVAVSLILLYATAQLLFNDVAARLSLFVSVLLLGLTQDDDLLHYSSELFAMVLLSVSYYLLARVFRRPVPSLALLAGLGLVLGMVPFGKLQGVPLAAVAGLFAGLDILFRSTLLVGQKAARLVALAAGALTFPLAFVLASLTNGVYRDFVTFYVMANFQYGSGITVAQSLLNLPGYLWKSETFEWFVNLTLGVWVLWAVLRLTRPGTRIDKQSLSLFAFLTLLTVAGTYAVTRTGYEYVHYLFFMITPLGLWLAWGLSATRELMAGTRWAAAVPASFAVAYLLLFSVRTATRYQQDLDLNEYVTEHQGGWRMPLSSVAQKVLQYAQAGEPLAVWGWRCDYYVQTQMPQGVAENHTIRSVFNHPLRSEYQGRYLANMIHSYPPVFVDAVGHNDLWLTNRKTQGHEVYPPLGHFIAMHYRYVGLVDDSRIYVRNDRVSEHANVASDTPAPAGKHNVGIN